MSEWRECKLVQITSKIGSGATPTGGGNAYKSEGISLIRSQNVLDFNFSDDGLAFIDELQADELRNVEVIENDILINITGESVTRCCIVPKKYLPARVNQHVSIVRLIPEQADFRFVYYYFHSIKPELHSMAEIGCTRRALTKGMLEQLDILLPPLPEQKAIAGVLSSLDDKIELLHRQNKTLEAMAEALFRQWFVEPCKDGLPEGWSEGKLRDIVTVVSGTTPKTKNPEYWDGEYHWTSPRDITNLSGLFLFDTERKITQKGLDQIGSGLLPEGSLLMSSRAPVGALAFVEIPVAINQGYAGIICNKGFSREFVYLWLKTNMDFVKSHANGSTFLEISKSTFRELDINIPDRQTSMDFNSLISPIFGKMKTNAIQIRTLEKLRDTLLPKLMNGEVTINE